jgi:hypothetical protein
VDWWNKIKLLNKSYTFSSIVEGYLKERVVSQFIETILRKKVMKEIIGFIRKYNIVTKRYWNIRKAILIKNYPAFQYPEVECFINTYVKINSETKFDSMEVDLKLLY